MTNTAMSKPKTPHPTPQPDVVSLVTRAREIERQALVLLALTPATVRLFAPRPDNGVPLHPRTAFAVGLRVLVRALSRGPASVGDTVVQVEAGVVAHAWRLICESDRMFWLLAETQMGLVRRRAYWLGDSFDDGVSRGRMTLYRAALLYDPEQGPWRRYAMSWILNAAKAWRRIAQRDAVTDSVMSEAVIDPASLNPDDATHCDISAVLERMAPFEAWLLARLYGIWGIAATSQERLRAEAGMSRDCFVACCEAVLVAARTMPPDAAVGFDVRHLRWLIQLRGGASAESVAAAAGLSVNDLLAATEAMRLRVGLGGP